MLLLLLLFSYAIRMIRHRERGAHTRSSTNESPPRNAAHQPHHERQLPLHSRLHARLLLATAEKRHTRDLAAPNPSFARMHTFLSISLFMVIVWVVYRVCLLVTRRRRSRHAASYSTSHRCVTLEDLREAKRPFETSAPHRREGY